MQNETPTPTPPNRDATTSPEGITTLNISGQNTGAMDGIAENYRDQSVSGARWFFWVAGLSLINSIVFLAEGRWNFLAGLGVVQLISGLAIGLSEQLGGAVKIVALILDLGVAAIFVGLGVFAQKHFTWAFVFGMVIYALDGLIFLMVQDWLSIAFHAFVLFSIYRGLSANLKLKSHEAEGLAPA